MEKIQIEAVCGIFESYSQFKFNNDEYFDQYLYFFPRHKQRNRETSF